jgi:hypothetical protein
MMAKAVVEAVIHRETVYSTRRFTSQNSVLLGLIEIRKRVVSSSGTSASSLNIAINFINGSLCISEVGLTTDLLSGAGRLLAKLRDVADVVVIDSSTSLRVGD